MRYWLMKSEPSDYSIEDLERDQIEGWDGIRNYQARNILRDDIKMGDLVIFYHSNAKPSGPAGVMEIVKEGYPDETALDPAELHYDPKATEEKNVWVQVDIKFVSKFSRVIPLKELRTTAGLEEMVILRKGNRLSVTPITQQEFEIICRLGA